MNNMELVTLNPTDVKVNLISKKVMKGSSPIVTNLSIDKRTNLHKHTQTEIIYMELQYKDIVNKLEYKWNITKTLVDFKNYLAHLLYYLTQKNESDFTMRSQMERIQKMSFLQMKLASANDIITLINYILSFDYPSTNNDGVFINEFFEISSHSFVSYNNGVKPKEGYISKRSEYSLCQATCIELCKCVKCCCCASYIKYWFLLKEDMICYLDSSTSQIGKNTFWFDKNTRIQKESNTITLRNSGKKMKLKFEESFDEDNWYNEINWRIEKFINNVKPNIYHSFVNEKTDCKARWFIDGADYFADLHDRLLNAKETVFITDWWMSPEIWLKRPVNQNEYEKLEFGQALVVDENSHNRLSRLCDILNYIADKGVRVYILVYREFSLALTLNSKHTKNLLINLSPNIQVTRHPKKSIDLLWSHHEKLVVIDQKYAYVGGLDLCWGRFDIHSHPLYDNESSEKYLYPGIDYSNARVADFMNVEQYLKDATERTKPRMPWHDIHSMLEGPAVLDISRHFVERWNYVKAYANSEGITDIKTTYQKQKTTLNDKLMFTKTITNKDNIRLDDDNKPQDLSRIDEEMNFDEVHINPQTKNNLMKKTQTVMEIDKDRYFKAPKNTIVQKPSLKQKLINKLTHGRGKKKAEGINHWVNLDTFHVNFKQNEAKMTCQCLRSLSEWSGGLNQTENSILQGYYNLIDNSKHYIYIENQFFISKSFTDEEYEAKGSPVSNLIVNEIALHLRNRIYKAYKNNEKFHVTVFIPLLPGFAGDVASSSTLQVVCKYTYKTISRNKGLSIIERLQELFKEDNTFVDPNLYKQYISFYSLRNHAMINGKPCTELIYIHSKLMIVDDKYVIMGSANINDRSMCGDRDSEFAVIYKEHPELDSYMDGKPYKAALFAKSLRMNIWKEHFGIEDKDMKLIEDPLSDEVFTLMNTRAENNTKIYYDLFKCYPDDSFKKFTDIPVYKEKEGEELSKFVEEYKEKSKGIVGHVVHFPLDFLKDEILERSFFSAEMLVPIKNFV